MQSHQLQSASILISSSPFKLRYVYARLSSDHSIKIYIQAFRKCSYTGNRTAGIQLSWKLVKYLQSHQNNWKWTDSQNKSSSRPLRGNEFALRCRYFLLCNEQHYRLNIANKCFDPFSAHLVTCSDKNKTINAIEMMFQFRKLIFAVRSCDWKPKAHGGRPNIRKRDNWWRNEDYLCSKALSSWQERWAI